MALRLGLFLLFDVLLLLDKDAAITNTLLGERIVRPLNAALRAEAHATRMLQEPAHDFISGNDSNTGPLLASDLSRYALLQSLAGSHHFRLQVDHFGLLPLKR